MCGHVGVAGFITTHEKDVFRDLLHLDYFRGKDSTGIANINLYNNEKSPYREVVYKSLGGPWNLYNKFQKDFYEDGQIVGTSDILIGHNRFATQGKVDENSAHPFVFENLIGAHNGTISQFHLNDFYGYKDFNIDSQIIFSQINHDSDLDKVWTKARGALALVWWDKRDGCLHFARNKERSLFYCTNNTNSTVFWASEEWMLKVALGKNNQQHKEISSFKEDIHYKYDVYEDEVVFVEEELETPPAIIYPIIKKEDKNFFRGGGNGGHDKNFYSLRFFIKELQHTELGPFFWGKSEHGIDVLIDLPDKEDPGFEKEFNRIKNVKTNQLWFVDWNKTKWHNSIGYYFVNSTDICLIDNKTNNSSSKKIVSDDEVKGFKGERLSKLEYEERLKDGCPNCLEVIEWHDRYKIRWTDSHNAYCPSCVSLPIIKQELKTIYGEKNNA